MGPSQLLGGPQLSHLKTLTADGSSHRWRARSSKPWFGVTSWYSSIGVVIDGNLTTLTSRISSADFNLHNNYLAHTSDEVWLEPWTTKKFGSRSFYHLRPAMNQGNFALWTDPPSSWGIIAAAQVWIPVSKEAAPLLLQMMPTNAGKLKMFNSDQS